MPARPPPSLTSLRALLPLAAALSAGACGTPARRLPTRVIDDPVTLPRRMIQLSTSVSGTLRNDNRARDVTIWPGIAYGITDRVTLTGPLSANFALLDDAPVAFASTGATAATSPFSLGIGGGFIGLGYADSEGWIYQPVLGVWLHKHLGSRVRIGAGISSQAYVTSRRHEGSHRAHATFILQVSERVALDVDVYDHWTFDTVTPSSRWTKRWSGTAPGLSYRPCHWFSLGLDVDVVFVRRPASSEPVAPDTPLPDDPGPHSPQIWGIVSTHFHW